jgi:hypothetical protein
VRRDPGDRIGLFVVAVAQNVDGRGEAGGAVAREAERDRTVVVEDPQRVDRRRDAFQRTLLVADEALSPVAGVLRPNAQAVVEEVLQSFCDKSTDLPHQ